MKKTLLVFAAFAFVYGVKAQQKPHYTQYILNNFIVNPAVAGIENYWDAKISHRRQWVGLDGAPVTTYATIHGPLSKDDYGRETVTTVHAPGENPRGSAYWDNYESAKGHHGVGFTILNDITGPINRTSVSGTYAYHLGIAPRISLSMGASIGLQNNRLDASKLNFGGPNPGSDPAVAGTGDLNKWTPDLAVGVWLYSADYFVGVSAQQLWPAELSFAEDNTLIKEKGKLVPHLFGTLGFRTFFTDDISFVPSVMVRYASPTPISFDVNAKVQYQDLFWVGGSYRYSDGFAGMIGVNISNTFNIGYSYDITTSRLNTVSKGSHEFLVGFLLGNKFNDWCPRNLW